MKNELIQHHQDCLEYRKKQKIAFDASEGGDWYREREQREYNDDMIRFHQRAIEFLSEVK